MRQPKIWEQGCASVGPPLEGSHRNAPCVRWATIDSALSYSIYPIEECRRQPQNQNCSTPNLEYVKRILVVDDSLLIRRSLCSLFEEKPDWTVCGEAENGSDAIDKAQKLDPDLIVIDLSMPVMNGIDATRILTRLMPTVPIVMYTTFADSHIKNIALDAGVRDLIDKSESASALIKTIERLVAAELPPPSVSAA
jgi:CheY-like chemotaxis protein